jgi:hypothetical protein
MVKVTTTKEFKQDLLFNIVKAILGLNTSNVALPTTNDLVVQGDTEKIFLMDGKYYLILFKKEDLLEAVEKKLDASLDLFLNDFKSPSYSNEVFDYFYMLVLKTLNEQLKEVEKAYIGRIEMLRNIFVNSGQPLNLSAKEEKVAQAFKEKVEEVIDYLSKCFLLGDSVALKNLQQLSLPYNKWMTILSSRLARKLSYLMIELSLSEKISKEDGVVRFVVSTNGNHQELSLLEGNPLDNILELYNIWKAKIRLFVDFPDVDYPFESQTILYPDDLLYNRSKVIGALEELPK